MASDYHIGGTIQTTMIVAIIPCLNKDQYQDPSRPGHGPFPTLDGPRLDSEGTGRDGLHSDRFRLGHDMHPADLT